MFDIKKVITTLEDATIEPMIAWLRLSYQDSAISGMVLQYKGFDGLWKCLLNRKLFQEGYYMSQKKKKAENQMKFRR